jgi:hypothetical protein
MRQAGATISCNVIEFPHRERVGIPNVQKINQFLIFEFGSKVRAILSMPEKCSLTQLSGPLFSLNGVITDLVAGDPIRLDYSMGNIVEVHNSIRSIIKHDYSDKNGDFDFDKDWSQPVSAWLFPSLKEALAKLEHTLAAEFDKTPTYLVAKTTSFDTATLIERATETFTEEVRSQLSDTAKLDFTEAGKCLGFGLYTAAGFHIARATEAVMNDYCSTFDVKVTNKETWGVLLKGLTNCALEVKPDKSTIVLLEQIKNVDRNDLMHPRKTLDLTEATRLFHLATSAIIAMTMEIRAKTGEASQGKLPLDQTAIVALPSPKVEAAE